MRHIRIAAAVSWADLKELSEDLVGAAAPAVAAEDGTNQVAGAEPLGARVLHCVRREP